MEKKKVDYFIDWDQNYNYSKNGLWTETRGYITFRLVHKNGATSIKLDIETPV